MALFERRHYVPPYVLDSMFPLKENGYDPMDIQEFERIAIQNFIRWQAEGYEAVYIYLSGLVSATTTVINAAYKVGIYIRLYHFSFLTNKWLPQLVTPIEQLYGPHPLDDDERLLWKEETIAKSQLTKNESLDLISYVRVYYELLHEYGSSNSEDEWVSIRNKIYSTYSRIDNVYIELMKPYLCLVEDYSTLRRREYTDVIREEMRRRRDKIYTARAIDHPTWADLRDKPRTKAQGPIGPKFKGRTYKRKHKHSYK